MSNTLSWLLAFLYQSVDTGFYRISGFVRRVLPVHHSSVPSQLIVALKNIFSQVLHADPSSVWCITWFYRFSDHYLSGGNPSGDNLLDCCSIELWSSGMNEKFLISIIFGVNLVVELNHVKVDQISHLVMDCLVCSMSVVLVLEVRSLGSMCYDVIRKLLSQYFGESNKPSFSSSSLHGFIIFPVKICTIEVVLFYIFSKFLSANCRISSCRSRELCSSKSANKYFDSVVIVPFLQVLLDFIITFSKFTLRPKVLSGICPQSSYICGTWTTHPESKENIVILMRRGDSRYC